MITLGYIIILFLHSEAIATELLFKGECSLFWHVRILAFNHGYVKVLPRKQVPPSSRSKAMSDPIKLLRKFPCGWAADLI